MEKLYTKNEYAKACVEANKLGKLVKLVQKEVEYTVEVLEWNKKTIEQQKYDPETGEPMYDDESNPIMESIEVDDYDNPIMVEEEIIDPETGEKKIVIVQKHHSENRTKIVEVIEIVEDDGRLARLYFSTSLGYVKRKVTMRDGTVKDFLADILPQLQAGVEILTYTLNGKQTKVTVTDEFINECKQQVFKDFYGG